MSRQSLVSGRHEKAKAGRAFAEGSAADDVAKAIQTEIASLRDLGLDDLRRRWRQMTGRSAPSRLPRFLLLRTLAYQLQAHVFGDLDKAAVDLLERIADAMTSPAARAAARPARSPLFVPPVDPRPIGPGAILVREWKGVVHRVTVLARGFAWNGEIYDSLSTIARAITGTEWSGPRFFGLRDRKGRGAATGDDQYNLPKDLAGQGGLRGARGRALRRAVVRPHADGPAP